MRITHQFNRIADHLASFIGSFWTLFMITIFVVISLAMHWTLASSSEMVAIANILQIFSIFMLIIVQLTQNKDTKALNLKMDAVLVSLEHAPNEMVQAEKKDKQEIKDLENKVTSLIEEDIHEKGFPNST